MNFAAIMEELKKFRDDSDFKQFHNTKNLSTSICIKAADLLEAFQWSNEEDIKEITMNDKTAIEEKMADIFVYLMYLCRNLGISSDSMEATIYSRIIKDSINMKLTGPNDTSKNKSHSKVVDFKHLEKSIVISLISSAALTALGPAFLELALLA